MTVDNNVPKLTSYSLWSKSLNTIARLYQYCQLFKQKKKLLVYARTY